MKSITATGVELIEPGDAVTWIWHNDHADYTPGRIWAIDGHSYELTLNCILLSKTPIHPSSAFVNGEHVLFGWHIDVLTTNNEVVSLWAANCGLVSGYVNGEAVRCVRRQNDE